MRKTRGPALTGGLRINIYTDERAVELARVLGKGNISAGIRLALERAAASMGVTVEPTTPPAEAAPGEPEEKRRGRPPKRPAPVPVPEPEPGPARREAAPTAAKAPRGAGVRAGVRAARRV